MGQDCPAGRFAFLKHAEVFLLIVVAGCSRSSNVPDAKRSHTGPPTDSSITITIELNKTDFKVDEPIGFRGKILCQPADREKIKGARVSLGNEIALGAQYARFASLVVQASIAEDGGIAFSGTFDGDTVPRKPGRYRIKAVYASPVSGAGPDSKKRKRPEQPSSFVYYQVTP